jgi:hypothetical protein
VHIRDQLRGMTISGVAIYSAPLWGLPDGLVLSDYYHPRGILYLCSAIVIQEQETSSMLHSFGLLRLKSSSRYEFSVSMRYPNRDSHMDNQPVPI